MHVLAGIKYIPPGQELTMFTTSPRGTCHGFLSLSLRVHSSSFPHRNAVPFTSTQVEAIRSGMQPGLTLVVGPPGTGKTDVAVQIISNIYHNICNR